MGKTVTDRRNQGRLVWEWWEEESMVKEREIPHHVSNSSVMTGAYNAIWIAKCIWSRRRTSGYLSTPILFIQSFSKYSLSLPQSCVNFVMLFGQYGVKSIRTVSNSPSEGKRVQHGTSKVYLIKCIEQVYTKSYSWVRLFHNQQIYVCGHHHMWGLLMGAA